LVQIRGAAAPAAVSVIVGESPVRQTERAAILS